jgi:predicted membrane protein
MSQPETLGSFFADSKTLLKEYLETRLDIYRLQSLRMFAKSAGLFVWLLLSLFLAFLFLLFGGMMVAFWFSGIFHSQVKGFGLVAGLILLIFVLLAIFRRALFVEPVIQLIIQKTQEEGKGEDHD